jgi:hypothetical protein
MGLSELSLVILASVTLLDFAIRMYDRYKRNRPYRLGGIIDPENF